MGKRRVPTIGVTSPEEALTWQMRSRRDWGGLDQGGVEERAREIVAHGPRRPAFEPAKPGRRIKR